MLAHVVFVSPESRNEILSSRQVLEVGSLVSTCFSQPTAIRISFFSSACAFCLLSVRVSVRSSSFLAEDRPLLPLTGIILPFSLEIDGLPRALLVWPTCLLPLRPGQEPTFFVIPCKDPRSFFFLRYDSAPFSNQTITNRFPSEKRKNGLSSYPLAFLVMADEAPSFLV